MRCLVIDEAAKTAIAGVIDYADKHRMSTAVIEARIRNGGPPIGDDPRYVCHLKVGYRCCFSFEEQKWGWSRHLSVSVDEPDKLPHMEAVKLLMAEFGFTQPVENCFVYVENGDSPFAVNVIGKEIEGTDDAPGPR